MPRKHCPKCAAEGMFQGRTCPVCDGKGTVEVDATGTQVVRDAAGNIAGVVPQTPAAHVALPDDRPLLQVLMELREIEDRRFAADPENFVPDPRFLALVRQDMRARLAEAEKAGDADAVERLKSELCEKCGFGVRSTEPCSVECFVAHGYQAEHFDSFVQSCREACRERR